MNELYEQFPDIRNDKIIIRKMIAAEVDDLAEITNNDNVYQYIPYLLYKKSKGHLLAAIRNSGDRDFVKKKCIIAGIYLVNQPDKLIGLAEMFDYKKRATTIRSAGHHASTGHEQKSDRITIGYRINEAYWNQGIATNVVKVMIKYLFKDIGIHCIQAFVMPENIYSSQVLLKNGFKKEDSLVKGNNWGGKDIVDLDVYTLCQDYDTHE